MTVRVFQFGYLAVFDVFCVCYSTRTSSILSCDVWCDSAHIEVEFEINKEGNQESKLALYRSQQDDKKLNREISGWPLWCSHSDIEFY